MNLHYALADPASAPRRDGDRVCDPLPTRLIHRLVLDLQLGCQLACTRAIEAETRRPTAINRWAYLLLVLRCDRGLMNDGGKAQRSGGITVSAIASSFGQPFETVRRNINELIEDGFCERRDARVRIRPAVYERTLFKHMLGDLHDNMVCLIAELASAGAPLPRLREHRDYSPSATVAAAVDLTLAGFEYGAPSFESWLQMRVLNAIYARNLRKITSHRGLARRFAFASPVPPVELLEPISSADIAGQLNLSPATARRQIRSAIERGWLQRRESGVVYTAAMLDFIDAERLPEASTRHALRTIERLAVTGFRFHQPMDHLLRSPDGASVGVS